MSVSTAHTLANLLDLLVVLHDHWILLSLSFLEIIRIMLGVGEEKGTQLGVPVE